MIRLNAFFCLAVTAFTGAAADEIIPIPNGDFEQGLEAWTIPANEGMSTLASDEGKRQVFPPDRRSK